MTPRARRILAVVVTHNRRTLLSRCLDAIEAQSRRADAIVVIDNASTDGTAAMVRDRGVEVIEQTNLGAAGGWRRGIDAMRERAMDAVWLMDDDGFPDPDALRQLDAALTDDVAAVSSVVVREDDPERLVFALPRLSSRGLPVLLAPPRAYYTLSEARHAAPGGCYAFAHLFNGALVPARAVAAAGNVEVGFFIFGEELDYLYRLRAVGPVLTVLGARHLHPDVGGRPLSDAKIYYYVKNTLILHRRYFDRPMLRGLFTIGAVVARAGRRNGVGYALSLMMGRRRAILRRAIERGRRGQVGRDFDV